MNWGAAAIVLGAVVGAATYVWLTFWLAIRLGNFVEEVTGSLGLGFGVYWISIFAALASPFAVWVGLSA